MKMKIHSTFAIGITMGLMMTVGAVASSITVSAGPADPIETNQVCDTSKINIVEGVDCSQGKDTQSSLFTEDDDGNSLFETVANVLLFLIGAVSVIMLIVGGFRYVLSGGDSTQVTSAKNTILYAVIGIIVALLAYAIVNFVVSSFIA